jgi:hypothetical protein
MKTTTLRRPGGCVPLSRIAGLPRKAGFAPGPRNPLEAVANTTLVLSEVEVS